MINELDENLDENFLEFCQSDCSDGSSFDDIKIEISDIEIKNSKTEILKYVLQTYAYVYFKVLEFLPNLKYGNYVLTAKTFF